MTEITHKYYFHEAFTLKSCKELVEWIEGLEENKPQTIEININSYGGSLPGLFAVLGAMRNSHHTFKTVAHGAIMSCGFMLFIMGDIRHLGIHTDCMSHKPWTELSGNEEDISDVLMNMKHLTKIFENILIERSNLDKKKVKELLFNNKDMYITPSKMKKYGLADKLI